jgi:DNA-directed RNA polymerase subunit M
MYPKNGKLVCRRCGAEKEMEKIPVIRETSKGRDMQVVEDESTLPKTRIECPKCHHNEAYWRLRQTRASDEPETRIYRCVKCGHTWREY